MNAILCFDNDIRYGNERAYNALRWSGSYAELIEGARRSTLTQLARWTLEADNVLVF